MTPPKKPRTETGAVLGHQVILPNQTLTTLSPAVAFQSPLTISIPGILPNYRYYCDAWCYIKKES